ncbi:hypothetical protein [Nocardia sp. NPDC002869]|uniref:hypothetical protein n=1 Tax=Nocardia sp. NPDC002869 TaxID=3161032 RepID=UPI00398D5884
MTDLPRSIVCSVQEQIVRYNLIPEDAKVAVAFSGGKDSLLLCLVLRDLGFAFTAVSVDMGYESGWGDRVRRLAVANGFTVELLTMRSEERSGSTVVPLEIGRRIDLLDRLAADRTPEAPTPCTHCYSVKALALHTFATERGISIVAFGHHMTDASASLLKEALLHIDRRALRHENFRRAHFEELVERLRREALAYRPGIDSPLVERIESLVHHHEVDTDEPPIQCLLDKADCAVQVIRPMHAVAENDIRRIVSDLGIRPEGSGCGHGATAATQTPREMVHYRVLDQPDIGPFLYRMRELVGVGIGKDGRHLVNARARRAEMLGPTYKPTGGYEKL